MAKFSGAAPRRAAVSTVVGSGHTFEGGVGVKYDARTELWNLTTAAMVGGEKSFYENGEVRDQRIIDLTRAVIRTPGGWDWICRFVPFLRNSMFMRTAPVMIAAEAADYRRDLFRNGTAEPSVSTVRILVASAIGRVDELAEFIGYWRMRFGRTIPGGVQRGLADAASEMLTEYSAMKYDGSARAIRIGDVINILHPEPKAPWQSDMFRYFLDRRHHSTDIRVNLDRLPMIASRQWMESLTLEERRQMADGSKDYLALKFKEAGMTWENAAGWLQRELRASDWEALIPTMGYMALLRNLRNFDKAGISPAAVLAVCDRLADPAQVAKSKQFPYRFYTAFRAANESFRWADTLSVALDLSTQNVPVLGGKTLVIVDTSGSMNATVSDRSDVRYVDVAALFGSVVASKNPEGVDVVAFADSAYKVDFPTKRNVLRNVDKIRGEVGRVGYGTNIGSAQQFLRPDYTRVVIFSDMQDIAGLATGGPASGFGYRRGLAIPANVTAYSFNLAGYEHGIVDSGIPNRFVLGGFSDRAFQMMAMVEVGKDQNWPF